MAKLSTSTGSRGFDTTDGSGTTDKITAVNFDNANFPTALTCAVWLKHANMPGGSQRIFDMRDTNEDAQWYFWVGSGGDAGKQRVEFDRHWSTSRGAWRIDDTGHSAGTWRHWVLTYDGASTSNNAAMYYNGSSQTLVETDAPSGTLSSSGTDMVVGNRKATSSARTFDGVIFDFALWNSVLSGANITDLAAGEDPDDVGSPVLHYEMSGTGTGVGAETNVAGTNYDGTVVGTAHTTDYPDILDQAITMMAMFYKRLRTG